MRRREGGAATKRIPPARTRAPDRRWLPPVASLPALTAFGVAAGVPGVAGPAPIQEAPEFQALHREARIDDLLVRLSEEQRPEALLIRNVRVLDLEEDRVMPDLSVLIEEGRITRVGPVGAVEVPPHATRVEGRGRYLMPGLVDAHVHVGRSNVEKILEIVTGVTTVREMAGFDWMLPLREEIAASRILAPNLYVAATMLNYFDLGIFAWVVRSEDEARQRVRAQSAAGFDYVKVWNVMPVDILQAIGEEAAEQGKPLTGHVPHNVTLAEAYAAGLRFQEHLKGYYLDNRLTITDEDYRAFTQASEGLWLTPTLAVSCAAGLDGEGASARLEGSAFSSFVPPATATEWLQSPGDTIEARKCRMQEEIFRDLVDMGFRRFVAGTDYNGSNRLLMPGFALHDEMRTMAAYGLPLVDVLRAATVQAARALERDGEFGVVEEGARADLLLLEDDPRRDLTHLLGPRDVFIRGTWLTWEQIQEVLDQVEDIQRATPLRRADELERERSRLVVRYTEEERFRHLVNPYSFMTLSGYLVATGHGREAVRLMDVAVDRFPWYEMYEVRGDARLAAGDTAGALRDYRGSVAAYPWNSSARTKLGRLTDGG